MKNVLILFLYTLLFGLTTQTALSSEDRKKISLAGEWELLLQTNATDSCDKTGQLVFNDVIQLPGTTDTNKKGTLITDKSETTHLSREYKYVGKAWYKKRVTIPADWKNKQINLTLERTKPTKIWVDNNFAGSNDNISTPQVYNLTSLLTPGEHELIVLVDNGETVPRQLLSSSHAYTESTQTNWNGVIGTMELAAVSPLHIESLQVYPDAKQKIATVVITLSDPSLLKKSDQIELSAKAWNTAHAHQPKKYTQRIEQPSKEIRIAYPMGDDALCWSEFDPALYELTAVIPGHDQQRVHFGLRDFNANGTQFTINDQLTFLRGKHDACVFPITGHTPMDVESWQRYFRICKEYGINHCRFHSWCPPAACFLAADMEGIYLQPELPFWGSLQRKEEYLCQFLLKEGINIQKEYGNHASFVLFAIGNELSGDQEVMNEFIDQFRAIDNRHMYAYGSNN